MAAVRIILACLTALVLGAHFLRAGHALLALVVVLYPSILLLRRVWAVRAVQLLLVAGALEWGRTAVQLVDLRRAHGQPFLRMALILGVVAAVTALTAVLLEGRVRQVQAATPEGR
jgi:hypothetical protein